MANNRVLSAIRHAGRIILEHEDIDSLQTDVAQALAEALTAAADGEEIGVEALMKV